MTDTKQRTVVFIDNQNIYKGARHGFFNPGDYHVHGQFDPIALGELICSRPPPGFTRELEEVRVYTGQPSASKDPKSYGASRRQYDAWEKRGATVIPRPLRYPPAYPNEKAEEKGIDVELAIDFIAMAIDGKYDVGVIASTDTDLIPAIDFVAKRYSTSRRAEVAAWSYRVNRNPSLKSNVKQIWCHWLNRADYDQIADLRDYTR